MINNTPQKSSSLFIKWFIVFASVIAVNAIAASYGLYALIWKSDISHISSIIGSLFLIGSLVAGKLSYNISKGNLVNHKKTLKVLHFMADSFFTLGLLGTIIGFCYMMQGTLNANVDTNQIIAQLKVGSSTKLYTTLSGIVTSLLLQLQLLVIENDLDKD